MDQIPKSYMTVVILIAFLVAGFCIVNIYYYSRAISFISSGGRSTISYEYARNMLIINIAVILIFLIVFFYMIYKRFFSSKPVELKVESKKLSSVKTELKETKEELKEIKEELKVVEKDLSKDLAKEIVEEKVVCQQNFTPAVVCQPVQKKWQDRQEWNQPPKVLPPKFQRPLPVQPLKQQKKPFEPRKIIPKVSEEESESSDDSSSESESPKPSISIKSSSKRSQPKSSSKSSRSRSFSSRSRSLSSRSRQ